MKITGKHPKKLNDPIIGNPAMHGKRWKIDYAYGPHTSYGKLSKRQVDEFAVNNMDTWIDTNHNDVDIGYNEFYEDLKPDNKLTGGVGDATASHNVDPVELSLGQSVEMEHTINPDIATEIALDHLSEDPKYYTKLRKAGLAKELDLVSSSSGFGDPDHPINNKKRLGSDITCTAGNNIVGKIGNTPDGHVEGFSDKTAIIKNKNLKQMNTDDFTVDLDIEEPALDEGKNSPTNKKLWSRALAAARSKFNVYPCVPLDSQAITKEGLKHYEDLVEGEDILSFNIEKDVLEWTPILKLHYYENAPIKRIFKPTGFSLRATENHKWVVKRGNNYQSTELIETKNLNKHMQLVCCSTLENEYNKSIITEKWSKKDNWVEKVFTWNKEQREIFLGAAIIYDGHDQGCSTKIIDRHTFGFTQKNTDHLWACLFAAYLNGYHVSFRNKTEDIYSATLIRNKKTHNTQNLKIEDDGIEDVWCPTTENNTWVMVQNGFITITGNSAYANAYAAKWYKKNGGGWRKTKSNESLNEASNSGGIITGQNPVGKVSTGKQSNSTSTSTSNSISKSTGQSQTTNPKINSGYQASKGPVEGSGEESLHDRPYNFFQYKRDNAKFGNGNIIKKSGRVSLSELAKQILNNTKDESGK